MQYIVFELDSIKYNKTIPPTYKQEKYSNLQAESSQFIRFPSQNISTGSALFISDKIESNHGSIKHISSLIPGNKDQSNNNTHSIEKILKQRVYLMIQGHEDANDVAHLKKNPILNAI
jgi:hypothetical protein